MSVAAVGGWPALSLISIPEGAPSLCLRSWQTQGGGFESLMPLRNCESQSPRPVAKNATRTGHPGNLKFIFRLS